MKRYSYFTKLKKHSRPLFWVILLYVIGTICLTLLNIQIAPFYVWSMYTTRENPANHRQYIVYEMLVDGKRYNEPLWKDFKRMTFNYSIAKFDAMQAAGYRDTFETRMGQRFDRLHLPNHWKHSFSNDTASIKAYPKWLKAYMSTQYGYRVNNIQVIKHKVHYDKNGNLVMDDEKVIINE